MVKVIVGDRDVTYLAASRAGPLRCAPWDGSGKQSDSGITSELADEHDPFRVELYHGSGTLVCVNSLLDLGLAEDNGGGEVPHVGKVVVEFFHADYTVSIDVTLLEDLDSHVGGQAPGDEQANDLLELHLAALVSVEAVKDECSHLLAGECITAQLAHAPREYDALWMHKVADDLGLSGLAPCGVEAGLVRVVDPGLFDGKEGDIEDDDGAIEEGHTHDAHGGRGAHGGAKEDGDGVAHLSEDVELGEHAEGDAVHHVDVGHDEPLEQVLLDREIGTVVQFA
mmetsp:Transcript_6391/g.17325  ORF Transcript_6391/g.17325 Transcript_6391/m.17325 type:complete len:282 (+) Transcript_6391:119-964(+)